jgi:integrase/recombinase XerD
MLSFKTNLKFKEITPLFLEQYQSWMEAKGNTLSTIGFYLRPLRNVFNTAIDNRIIHEKLYPFGRRRYIIPSGDNIKKAICTESLNKLYYHAPSCNQEEMYRDFWFFIYFGNGMNMKDVALLKYGKINGDWIYFNRAKTERTAKGKRRIVSVYLSDDMKRIIDRWGNKDKAADNYIFPILRNGLDQYAIRDKVQLFIKRVNFWMGVIAKSEGVEEAVLTMAGRHAFATQLRDADVNKEFIREALGQIDPESIDHYFAKFQNTSHIGYVTNLESFKGNKIKAELSTEEQIGLLLEQLSKLMKQNNTEKANLIIAG